MNEHNNDSEEQIRHAYQNLAERLGDWEPQGFSELLETRELSEAAIRDEIEIVSLVEALHAARFRYGENLTEQLSRVCASHFPQADFVLIENFFPEKMFNPFEIVLVTTRNNTFIVGAPSAIPHTISRLLNKLFPLLGTTPVALHFATRTWYFPHTNNDNCPK